MTATMYAAGFRQTHDHAHQDGCILHNVPWHVLQSIFGALVVATTLNTLGCSRAPGITEIASRDAILWTDDLSRRYWIRFSPMTEAQREYSFEITSGPRHVPMQFCVEADHGPDSLSDLSLDAILIDNDGMVVFAANGVLNREWGILEVADKYLYWHPMSVRFELRLNIKYTLRLTAGDGNVGIGAQLSPRMVGGGSVPLVQYR